MTTIEDPRRHRFLLNNGTTMPALGFGPLVSDSRKTRMNLCSWCCATSGGWQTCKRHQSQLATKVSAAPAM